MGPQTRFSFLRPLKQVEYGFQQSGKQLLGESDACTTLPPGLGFFGEPNHLDRLGGGEAWGLGGREFEVFKRAQQAHGLYKALRASGVRIEED